MIINLLRKWRWSLMGASVWALIYSAITLTSTPAYAGTCTAQQCANANTTCNGLCITLYHVQGGVLRCVVGSAAYTCRCNNNQFPVVDC
jgi:hypothetical protein